MIPTLSNGETSSMAEIWDDDDEDITPLIPKAAPAKKKAPPTRTKKLTKYMKSWILHQRHHFHGRHEFTWQELEDVLL